MTTEKKALAVVIRAYTPDQVADMLQEPVRSIVVRCRTQALKGAYKTGGRPRRGLTPPASTRIRRPVRLLVSINSTASEMKPPERIRPQNTCVKSGRMKIEYFATTTPIH